MAACSKFIYNSNDIQRSLNMLADECAVFSPQFYNYIRQERANNDMLLFNEEKTRADW